MLFCNIFYSNATQLVNVKIYCYPYIRHSFSIQSLNVKSVLIIFNAVLSICCRFDNVTLTWSFVGAKLKMVMYVRSKFIPFLYRDQFERVTYRDQKYILPAVKV